ncbi:hypothetical protein [Adhaeribacter terreus]|uniref:Uncharacterized protein n=1 Tax=Adhaeribacter terreus TaxID=529703 RepID=A0ABW0EDZ9_9BACT
MHFGIKMILAFAFSFLLAENANALCAAEYVGIYPREGSITRNPVFLLEFEAAEFKLTNKLDELEFYLLTNKQRKIKVTILRKVNGIGPDTQFLLQAKEQLKLNDSVQLQVQFRKNNAPITDSLFQTYQHKVGRRKWHVTLAADYEPVAWKEELTWQEPDFRVNSVGNFGVKFSFQVEDSNPVYYDYTPGNRFLEQLFEVEMDGKIFYAIGGGRRNQFSIYRSDCGGNFYLNRNKNYEANITALDFSGNRSKEVKRVAFNTFMR